MAVSVSECLRRRIARVPLPPTCKQVVCPTISKDPRTLHGDVQVQTPWHTAHCLSCSWHREPDRIGGIGGLSRRRSDIEGLLARGEMTDAPESHNREEIVRTVNDMAESVPETSRDISMDALKGLAIALVVLGHAIPVATEVAHGGPGLYPVNRSAWVPLATATSLWFSLVYSFHMPLFAFVSGYVMWPPRARSFWSQLLRSTRGLLVPYMAWLFVYYLVARLINRDAWPAIGGVLVDAVAGRSGLWYLYALFMCTLVIAGLARLPYSRWTIPASVVLVFTAAAMYLALVSTTLPAMLYLADTLWIYPFVVLGYLVACKRDLLVRHRRLVLGLALATFVPLFYLRYPIYADELQPLTPFMQAAGATVTYAVTKLVAYTCASAAVLGLFAVYAGRAGAAIRSQAWLGRRSLGVYAVHGVVLTSLVSAGVRNPPILFVVSLGASVLITILIERIPLLSSFLLGQPRMGAQRHTGGVAVVDLPDTALVPEDS